MLAYYVEWHTREKLAPLLLEDDDPGGTGQPGMPLSRARAAHIAAKPGI
ncbi:MAG: hypothetical protein OXN84_20405 [Albidovulum sp.]|nr:hypothetical protein [Albidovulum sp.]